MHCFSRRLFSAVLGASLLLTPATPVLAQPGESRSVALARQLTALLLERKLDSVAARLPNSQDQFVAALFFPGQLMVITARHSSPPILNEKLARREYRDVYIDLNSASIAETRIMFTDGGADGFRPKRTPNQPFDMRDAAGKSIGFDGNWREDRMSEKDYMAAFADADAAYTAALEALLGALKPTS